MIILNQSGYLEHTDESLYNFEKNEKLDDNLKISQWFWIHYQNMDQIIKIILREFWIKLNCQIKHFITGQILYH